MILAALVVNELLKKVGVSLKIMFSCHRVVVRKILDPEYFWCMLIGVTAVRTRDHEDYHDDATRPKGESSAKRQKISKHGTFTRGESSSSQAMDESTPSSSGTLEQLEDFDAWQDDQGIDDDEVPSEECHQNCEEHQYHLDQMKSYMESQIVWESRKEDLTLQIPKKPSPVFQSCERNPKILPMSLVNQGRKEVMGNNIWRRLWFKRADGKYSEFMYLHKNDIEDMYLMCINEKIKDYRETGLLKSLTPLSEVMSSRKEFMIISWAWKVISRKSILLHQLSHSRTLKRVLEKVKKFNLDVKHGYADPDLNKEDA
ncbi:hypothetical protein Tco_1507702 [Tanacetum coccineum]